MVGQNKTDRMTKMNMGSNIGYFSRVQTFMRVFIHEFRILLALI